MILRIQKRRRLCTGAPLGALRCSEVRTSSKGRAPKEDRHQGSGKERRAAAASVHQRDPSPGQEWARVDPSTAADEAGLDVGDVGSERYRHALGYLVEEAAL